MKRRLYFIIPDVKTARLVHNELLLSRIPETHMHVIAKDESILDDLPRANLLQKSDLIHAIQTAIPIGGIIGVVMGALAIAANWVSAGYEGVVLMATVLAGVIIGTLSSTMIAVAVPNTRHMPFEKDIEQGKLLFIVDVPVQMVDDVSAMVASHHPDADMRGIEPNIPVFP